MQVIDFSTLPEAGREAIAWVSQIHCTSGIGNETATFIVNWYHNPAAHSATPRIEPDAEPISDCRVDSTLLQVRMFGSYRGQPERKFRVRPPDRLLTRIVHSAIVLHRV
jgi:hypothetical protein